MPSVTEAARSGSQLEAALVSGLRSIDRNQQITFMRYSRTILPLDGYVFWVNTGVSIQVSGSLHYAVDVRQAEDETIAVNSIELTSEKEIQEFNAISPGLLWIGTLGDAAASAGPSELIADNLVPSPVLFAFSSRSYFYRKADVYHYAGVAVQPPLLSQLINSPSALPTDPIVSNSLPIWLSLTQYAPVYPSFLVPDNVVPPYIAAHVEPTRTAAVQAFPLLTGWPAPPIPINPTLYDLTSEQLCSDYVRLSLYGFNNQRAQQFLYYLIEYSRNTDAFGFMSSPAFRDEKRTQREISAIAQKKCLDMQVSYYQSAADVIARRLIVEAFVTTSIASI